MNRDGTSKSSPGAASTASPRLVLSRREFLQVGGLGSLSVTLPGFLVTRLPAATGDQPVTTQRSSAPAAKSLIFVFLYGGPAHQDTFDMKPDAPIEIRGEFKPIRTNVPGVEICEHMPQLAQHADKFALVRSVTHTDMTHGSGGYAALTGWPYPVPNTEPSPSPEDYPSYGSLVSHLRPTDRPVPQAVTLAYKGLATSNDKQVPGQNGGFLGPSLNPFVVTADPNDKQFDVESLALPAEIPLHRLRHRRTLLTELNKPREHASGFGKLYETAFRLLGDSASRKAFDLTQESPALRDRYGRHTSGQACLLARRLVEAGVPVVTIYVRWGLPDIAPWDTHGNNFVRLKNTLLPHFDRAISALLEDLSQRGLLNQTLVACMGEMGRTPRIGLKTNGGASPDGRDHWSMCYTAMLGGGGIRGGTVIGSSDKDSAYPASHPVGPWDVAATMYSCLGIDPSLRIRDRQNRELSICRGNPIGELL